MANASNIIVINDEAHHAWRIPAESKIKGVKKEDIQIDFSRGVLYIKGEKKQEQKQENEKYHVVERRFGSFERRMKFATAAKPEEIKATFNDGVLELLIPKAVEQNQESRVLIG